MRKVESLERVVNIVEFVETDMIIMRHIQRIFLKPAAYLAEIADRTAYADKLRIGIDILIPIDFVKMLGDVFFDKTGTLQRVVRRVGELFGQRDRSERQRVLSKHYSAVIINKFYAAAAYIHDKTFRHVHTVYYSGINESRFFFLT